MLSIKCMVCIWASLNYKHVPRFMIECYGIMGNYARPRSVLIIQIMP